MAPPLPSPAVPSLTRGGSREALAFPGAQRPVAQVLSCKHVRLGCSKKLQQRGSKAVRSALSRSPESTMGAAEQRHRARPVKESLPAPRAGCPCPEAGVGTEECHLMAQPVGAEKPSGRPEFPERAKCCLSLSPKIQATLSWGPLPARERRDACVCTQSPQGTRYNFSGQCWTPRREPRHVPADANPPQGERQLWEQPSLLRSRVRVIQLLAWTHKPTEVGSVTRRLKSTTRSG